MVAFRTAARYRAAMHTRGIHLIWTTYGTWLPGDDRGHWSPLFDFYGQLVRAGHQLNLPDPTTQRIAASRMVDPPKTLTEAEREVVAGVLGRWFPAPRTNGEPPINGGLYSPPLVGGPPHVYPPVCHATALEADHVHLLIGPLSQTLQQFVGRLKGPSASAVLKLSGNQGRRHVWTADFWKVFLFDDEALPIVRTYIVNHNRRRGLPDDPYPWVTPI
jgi:hypothetical protein